ncbi:DNA-damage-inducible protein J [Sterolibacterium denitrificans]|uniref:DNA-damage-inducible protein J n=2 Tax=Sterolibacterium denitrificans TaxID=157592 RepID=A0A7Z7HTF8_9PROT|nr:type II toxin-antitoxin system RelB/DinJ family antitoxin [Sterolibacterium denitrificans]KYC29285.1 translation repressor RelB [Sterolibacterium denitrificans]SMB30426.1 DNA-damage-inducible protein J [Sterolibacterium denitrificans]
MTTTADTFVRARIDSETKDKATAALQAMGLSVSDALRILLRRVAADQAFPLELKVPNAETRAAIEELESGNLPRAHSVAELMRELHADD